MKKFLKILTFGLGLGAPIGLLIGLSNTPVIADVLSVILGLIVTSLLVLSGLKGPLKNFMNDGEASNAKNKITILAEHITIEPIIGFIWGVTICSLVGIYIRNNHCLIPDLNDIVTDWEEAIEPEMVPVLFSNSITNHSVVNANDTVKSSPNEFNKNFLRSWIALRLFNYYYGPINVADDSLTAFHRGNKPIYAPYFNGQYNPYLMYDPTRDDSTRHNLGRVQELSPYERKELESKQ